VLTVLEGQAEGVAELVDQYGEAIRVEESVAAPSLANHPFIDGGMPYFAGGGRCSVGFNVRNPSTGVGFFLTAGHCHGTGAITSSHGIDIGPVVASFFPGFDDALVRNDNPGQWLQGPWISTHPGFITVGGMADPPVGTAICKSGSTTQVTCGEVTVTDETVQLVDGSIINNLTRHDACVERGDSGGSNYTAAGTLAAGVTSAAALTAADRCLETIGEQNVSWYYPLTLSLPFYESTHGVELLTG
jgi:streptogrisin C